MLDIHGKLIRVGDRLKVGGDWTVGVVVCSMDDGEYSAAHPKEQCGYLGRGIMVDTEKAGLIHYVENDDDLEIILPYST
jgi:hypothetical protein